MRRALGLLLVSALWAGCATTRVVPVPAAGVAVAPGQSAATGPDGVQLVVRPSAWQGFPGYLPSYVTPFYVELTNGSGQLLAYDYVGLRLYDEARFQYTALPPAQVVQILQAGAVPAPPRLVASAAVVAPLHRRHARLWDPFWDPFWDPWWWGPPYPYVPPRYDEVFLRALPVVPLQPGARTQGFAYFPRLRPEARRLTFEFAYRLGETPRILTLPFAVERG